MRITVGSLDKNHDRSAFESGDSDLDNYLKHFAGQNQFKHLVGTTYVATTEDQPFTILGYYTLAATSIPFYSVVEVPELRKLPYANVPAVLLARLAVSKKSQNRGIGRQLLGDAVRRSLALTQVVGCRCLVIDAYPDAVNWYAKFGIILLGSNPPTSPTCRMLLDLRTAAVAAKRAAVLRMSMPHKRGT